MVAQRTRDGWEIIQVALPTELVTHVRVVAAMRRQTNGDILNELAQIGLKDQGGLKSGIDVTLGRSKPKEIQVQSMAKAKAESRPAKVTTPPEDYHGKPWDQARLDKAMDHAGLSTQKMADQLVTRKTGAPPSRNLIHSWRNGKEAIPSSYWPQLERIFGGVK